MQGDVRLSASDLTKRFGTKLALDRVSFTARAGEIVGILGANGAGKSTLMGILAGLVQQDHGRLELFGTTFTRARAAILRRMNIISPYVSPPGQLTVRQTLALYADLYDVPEPRVRADRLLARFGVEPLADARMGKLSSGQAARVNLCRAFLNEPDLLLLDEPTAYLDAESSAEVRVMLDEARAARGMTVLLTTHNAHDVERLCDRLVLLSRGTVVADGSPLEVTRPVLGSALDVPAPGDLLSRLR